MSLNLKISIHLACICSVLIVAMFEVLTFVLMLIVILVVTRLPAIKVYIYVPILCELKHLNNC